MQNHRFAIVITHADQRSSIAEMPWLETEYQIDDSDWLIFSEDAWRDLANGEPETCKAVEEKLLVSVYISQPQLIAVIGYPGTLDREDDVMQRQSEVRRIVERIRALLLPAGVMGIWTDPQGDLEEILETTERPELEPVEAAAMS